MHQHGRKHADPALPFSADFKAMRGLISNGVGIYELKSRRAPISIDFVIETEFSADIIRDTDPGHVADAAMMHMWRIELAAALEVYPAVAMLYSIFDMESETILIFAGQHFHIGHQHRQALLQEILVLQMSGQVCVVFLALMSHEIGFDARYLALDFGQDLPGHVMHEIATVGQIVV